MRTALRPTCAGEGQHTSPVRNTQTSHDRVADEYVRRIFDELRHKALDRQLLDRFAAGVRHRLRAGARCQGVSLGDKRPASIMRIQFTATALFAAALLFTLHAAEPRPFEGINLNELNETQQWKEMPEIYERDPANRRRFQLRRAVVQVPWGAAWITFNPERRASYVNKVPGENAASYFGPIAGDAFEVFKLEETFIAKLRADYAGDVAYRIELMLRTGDATLRERALRIMTAGLASDIAAETRANHLPKFKELAAQMTGEDVVPLLVAIAQTEQRIDELTDTLPDSEYSPGNYELAWQDKLPDGMKPTVGAPDSAWGQPVNGLRAAAVYTATNAPLGDEITVGLLVENVSDREIRFGCSDVIQSARAKITRADGKEVQASSVWYSGMAPIQRYKLKPGERVTLATKRLLFDNKEGAKDIGFGGERAMTPSGTYQVHYESVLSTGSAWNRHEDGLMHRVYPAKGEWTGWLTTGDTEILITGKEAAIADPPAPAAPVAVPVTTPVPPTKSIHVNVMDATGKNPIKEFRVVAGVKSSLGGPGIKEIINWQPHTLRSGTDGALSWPLAKAYDSMALRVEADGYAPQTFAWLDKKKPHDVAFRLTEDRGITARVLLPDGKPAAGATVALAMVQREATLEHGMLRHADDPLPEKDSERWRWPRFVKADAEGRFQLPAENDPTAAVLMVHERGIRETTLAELKPDMDVKLQAWARLAGRVQWGRVPGTNRHVRLSAHRDTYGYPGVIAQSERTTTDADGRFTMERVLPGVVQLSCPIPATSGNPSGLTEINLPGMTTQLTVQPGNNSALLGGQGRVVNGRLVGRESWSDVTFHFHPTAPRIGFAGDHEIWSAWRHLESSSVGPVFFRKDLKVSPDGSFEIPDVLPGSYQIFFSRAGEKGFVATSSFIVPEETPGTKPEPQSVGDFQSRIGRKRGPDSGAGTGHR